MTEGGERHVHDARPDPGRVLGSQAETGEGARTIGLAEHVRVAKEGARLLSIARLAEVERCGELSEARVHHEPEEVGQMPRADHQHVRAVRGEGAATHRPRDDAGQIEHADAGQRA